MLDALHDSGIEIVSPGFRNMRNLADDTRVIPVPMAVTDTLETTSVLDKVVFDKAEEATTLESLNAAYETLGKRIEERSKDGDKAELKRLEEKRELLKGSIERRQAQAEASE